MQYSYNSSKKKKKFSKITEGREYILVYRKNEIDEILIIKTLTERLVVFGFQTVLDLFIFSSQYYLRNKNNNKNNKKKYFFLNVLEKCFSFTLSVYVINIK